MKKIFFIISTVLIISAGCSSQNKGMDESETTDTSGYQQQPADQTQVNDTLNTLAPDTIQH
jgi:uncharacterized protein YdeI (BOF family)